MDNSLMKKLKRKPKWKLKEERDELQMEQKLLRKENETLDTQVQNLKNDLISAFKGNDQSSIAVLEQQIKNLESRIVKNSGRYTNNAEVLEIYSKVLKNDREGKSSMIGSWVGAITGLVGAGAAVAGLKMAYNSDNEGTLVHKKTLEWVKGLPIIRNFGRK